MAGEGQPTSERKPLILRREVLRLLLMALLAETGYAVLNISTMPVYLRNDRGFTTGIIGLVVAAFLLSEAIFKGPMGAIADRFGCKRLIVWGPAISVVTSTLSVMVPHDYGATETVAFMVLRVLDGVGAAMLWPAAFALMSDTVDDSERQQGMSLLNTCYLAGVGLAMPLGGVVNDWIGPHLPPLFSASPGLFLATLLFAAVAVTAYVTVPEDRKTHEHHEGAGEFNFRGLIEMIHLIPEYLLLAVITFAGIGFPMVIIKIFALEQFNLSETQFGALVLPAVGLMALLSVPMAKLGEKIGQFRAVHVGMFLCSAGLAFICLGTLIPYFREPWVFAIGGIPVGFGFLLAIPAWMANVSDINPTKRAAALGAVMTAQGVGAIIGAPVGSFLYDRLQPVGEFLKVGIEFGRYSPFVGCAVCVTIGWLLSLRILREKPKALAADSPDVGREVQPPEGGPSDSMGSDSERAYDSAEARLEDAKEAYGGVEPGGESAGDGD